MIYGELERQNAPEYDFFVPMAARWKKLDGDADTDENGNKINYIIKDLQEEIGYVSPEQSPCSIGRLQPR